MVEDEAKIAIEPAGNYVRVCLESADQKIVLRVLLPEWSRIIARPGEWAAAVVTHEFPHAA